MAMNRKLKTLNQPGLQTKYGSRFIHVILATHSFNPITFIQIHNTFQFILIICFDFPRHEKV
jgi:hypothetical protein